MPSSPVSSTSTASAAPDPSLYVTPHTTSTAALVVRTQTGTPLASGWTPAPRGTCRLSLLAWVTHYLSNLGCLTLFTIDYGSIEDPVECQRGSDSALLLHILFLFCAFLRTSPLYFYPMASAFNLARLRTHLLRCFLV
ncbi:hypothetical protein BKA62DRAFT_124511 [Auriculariales sp. MPI-PUGE-AT-0066]|nr:hypothetical protein BKA62DRAFT_124511 [Auriculariales sp. MPI-PUGE-AT-0066]